MKALVNVQTHWFMQNLGQLALKHALSLRLNAFFSKNDVKFAKTPYFAVETRFFLHIIRFNAMEALGNVQTHRIMQNQAN